MIDCLVVLEWQFMVNHNRIPFTMVSSPTISQFDIRRQILCSKCENTMYTARQYFYFWYAICKTTWCIVMTGKVASMWGISNESKCNKKSIII